MNVNITDIPQNCERRAAEISATVYSQWEICRNNIFDTGSASTSKSSFLVFDQQNKNFSFGKINHLTVRNCENCNIDIEMAISGIDVLFCKNVQIRTCINFLEIWNCVGINIIFQEYQKIIVSYSMDVFFNNENIWINPFQRRHYPKEETVDGQIQTFLIN